MAWFPATYIFSGVLLRIVELIYSIRHYSENARCLRNDSEKHEAVLLDCTTGEAGRAIQ